MSSKLTHGVILDMATLHSEDLDLSALRATLPQWDFHEHSSASNAVERLRDTEVVVTNKFVIDAALLAQTPKLKLICVAATGTNNIDLSAASERGVAVTNVTGYATPSVVEHVFALILSLQRRLHEHAQAAQDLWPNQRDFSVLDFPTQELRGKTLGIVGYGELGRAVANVGTAFGMCVLIAQRPGGDGRSNRAPLDDVLRNADVFSLHCPLTPATRNLIGTRELALMKPSALLINTARGGIVDEAALVSALQHQQLGGAGIDVLIEEPPRHGDPLLEIQLPNLIVTPHVAWASREARQRLVKGLTENICAYLEGKARNRVC